MIHPTAIVETTGQIADNVEIGPYAVIQGDISIGAGCRIAAHVQLLTQVILGENCSVGPGSVLGTDPQDLGFDPATPSGVIIGKNNTLREHITIHRSSRAGKFTRAGEGNYLMAGSHLGHDAQIGNANILANNSLLGGFVTVGNRCFFGGGTAFHQEIRIGDVVMVRGLNAMSQDIPPFVLAYGYNRILGLNSVGLKRAGVAPPARKELKAAFHLVYASGLNLREAIAQADSQEWIHDEAKTFWQFVKADTKKGVCCRLTDQREV